MLHKVVTIAKLVKSCNILKSASQQSQDGRIKVQNQEMNFERIFPRRYDRSSKPTTNKISRLTERQPKKSKGYLKDSK